KVPAFDIDLGQLRINYLKFQQRVHPDRYGNKNEAKYAHAQQYSSLINKAYQTLRDPLSRAKYILQLNDISISESESLEDPELLMKILDTRERLEEATDENEAKNIKDESEVRINEIITKLTQAFKSNDLVQAKVLTIRLQYWYNIREAAIEWEPGKPIEIHH
ncbi:Co-chaperone HscB, C-terminal oligomerization domain-containing protein, partial [Gigaspora rosea]